MALLNDEIVKGVTEMLAGLDGDVRLAYFSNSQHCDYCPQIEQLLDEVAATTNRVSVEKYELYRDAEQAAALNIDMAPAIAILGKQDFGVRFFGIPSGYEFSTLLHAIQRVAAGDSELDGATKSYLADLNADVQMQVFVTPTCPYCPRAATLAIEMAIESPKVRAEIVESAEFPDLANRFSVMGVPLTVVNGQERVEGAAPPQMVVSAIQRALA